MLRYDLDKLGWHSFECLCQTLLKHKLGFGIEAWGGHKDWGRDAYYEGQLNYPTKKKQEGPFIFQCKFVNGANAAGAKNNDLILKSVKQECKSIEKKLKDRKTKIGNRLIKREWDIAPTTYTFISNSIIRPPLRKKIEQCIKGVLPNCKFVKWDGKDICGMIDLTDGIAKRFPPILSLNDLESLLSNCVDNDLLNRSSAAIEEAKEISKVFVPTESYAKAFNVLSKFHYVVLEGPPEVGKTAIGRMIALSYIPEGWEAIECHEPRDFLRKYDENEKQIFVADDSFGRTEYRPERVSLWQDELPSILRKINKDHLLILTSRKHLLEMAKEKLDIPGVNRDFPLPAEVLVDVSSLTDLNKTLMLYRHMKNAELDEIIKKDIRKFATLTIKHKGFTPERLRELTERVKSTGITSKLVNEMLQNPTGRMSKTYRELPIAHKWLMISVLLEPSDPFLPSETTIESLYENLCPPEYMIDFNKIKNQLSEAFIKIKPLYNISNQVVAENINWVHPSCGDMVAKELSNAPRDRMHFLKNCDITGLKYAISVGGGSKGSDVLPLLKSPKDWGIFKDRCNDIFNLSLFVNMLNSIEQLAKHEKHHKKQQLLEDALKAIAIKSVDHFNEKGWPSTWLITILKTKKLLDIELPKIKYRETWLEYADSVMEILEDDCKEWNTFIDIDNFIRLTNTIADHSPLFLIEKPIKQKWKNVLTTFQNRGDEESNTYIIDIPPDEAEELYNSYDSLITLFEDISSIGISEIQNKEFIEISENFDKLREDVSRYLPYEPEYDRDDDMSYSSQEGCDIEQIFEDL